MLYFPSGPRAPLRAATGDADMLDLFIIEKIRRERERREQEQIPLHLPLERSDYHQPPPMEHRPPESERQEREGGVVIVDFTI